MRGGKNKKPHGYTIVEVMIVLAISGVMFLIAVVFIQGKGSAVQFTQGVNEFNSRIQATIQEVADGQYASLSTLGCTAGSTSLTISTGGSGQGVNDQCIFMGKVVAGYGSQYKVVSVAGRRLDPSTGQPGANPLTSVPWPIDDTSNRGGPLDALVDQVNIQNGVRISGSKITVVSAGTTNSFYGVYGLALLTAPTGFASTSGSGAQTVGLYYLSGIDSTSATNLTSIDNAIKTGMQPATSAILCLDDGGSRKAAIVIGAGGNQLTSIVDRTGAVTCS